MCSVKSMKFSKTQVSIDHHHHHVKHIVWQSFDKRIVIQPHRRHV